MPEEPESHQRTKPRFAANLLGYLLDRLSTLYVEPPHRTVGEEETWDRIMWSYGVGLDALIDDAMQAIRLTGTALAYIQPSFGDGPQDAEMLAEAMEDGGDPDGLGVHLIPMHQWVQLGWPGDARHIAAVAILVDELHSRTDASDTAPKVMVHHYWDSEWFAVLHDWTPVREVRHGIGMPPVAPLKGTLSPLYSYGRPLGGDDIVTNFRSINSCDEEILHTSRLQRGQLVVVGEPQAGVFIAPDVPLYVEAQGDATFINNGASVSSMVEGETMALERIAVSNGMPMSVFRGDSASRTDRVDIGDDRARQEKVWQANEFALHRVASAVWRDWTGQVLPYDVKVTYPVRQPPLTHDEILAEVKLQLSEGLISRTEAIRRLDPDKSPQEIEDMLREADEDMPARMRWHTLIAGHAQDLEAVEANTPGEPVTQDQEPQDAP
jgi:hypothetical protein